MAGWLLDSQDFSQAVRSSRVEAIKTERGEFVLYPETILMTEGLLHERLVHRPTASRRNFTHDNTAAAIEIVTSGFPAAIIS